MAMVVHSYRTAALFLVLLTLAACLSRDVSADQGARLTLHAQSLFRAGTASLRSGDFRTAVTAFQKFLELNKEYGPAYLNLGLAYHSLNQYEQVIPSLTEALELNGQLESAALFLGIDYSKTNVPEKAVERLQKALALEPGDPDAHLWLGRAVLGKGFYREAIPHLEKASTVYPQDLSIQYDLVQSYLMVSEQISDNIYSKDPHSYWDHLFRGQAHQLIGEDDLAIADFRQALRLNPTLQGGRGDLGDLYLKRRDLNTAEAEFKKELGVDPYNFSVVCKLGDLLIQTGKMDEAMPTLEKAAQVKPSLGCIHYELVSRYGNR